MHPVSDLARWSGADSLKYRNTICGRGASPFRTAIILYGIGRAVRRSKRSAKALRKRSRATRHLKMALAMGIPSSVGEKARL